jgi:hypothetical protein
MLLGIVHTLDLGKTARAANWYDDDLLVVSRNLLELPVASFSTFIFTVKS